MPLTTGRWSSRSSRPTRSTYRVPGQSRLHRETFSQKKNKTQMRITKNQNWGTAWQRKGIDFKDETRKVLWFDSFVHMMERDQEVSFRGHWSARSWRSTEQLKATSCSLHFRPSSMVALSFALISYENTGCCCHFILKYACPESIYVYIHIHVHICLHMYMYVHMHVYISIHICISHSLPMGGA